MAAAKTEDVTFLTNAKNAANSTILPGAGPEAVGVWIDVYSADDTLANLHSLMEFFPSALEVGAKAGYSVSNELLCGASASGTSSSGALTVTARASASESDCSGTTNSPVGTYRFLGEFSKSLADYFGYSVGSADFNGDGIDDLAVGAYLYDKSGGDDYGAVYVFYGGASFAGEAATSADATFIGKAAGDRFGVSVGSGDMNGDGVADLIVGAELNSDGGNTAGAAYIFYGGASFAGEAATSADATFIGKAAGDSFGVSVGSGDINGDGVADLIVGANFNADGGNEAGAAYIFYGGSSFAGQDLSGAGTADDTFIGAAAFDSFGGAVGSGDMNGDGVADLIVGAYSNDDGGGNAGAAYVILGKAALDDIDFSA